VGEVARREVAVLLNRHREMEAMGATLKRETIGIVIMKIHHYPYYNEAINNVSKAKSCKARAQLYAFHDWAITGVRISQSITVFSLAVDASRAVVSEDG
jgi:hypothetical protein